MSMTMLIVSKDQMRFLPSEIENKCYDSSVEIGVACRNLQKKNKLKPNPMVVIYDLSYSDLKQAGRTEVQKSKPDPTFEQRFSMPYLFEYREPLRFKVYDVNSPNAELRENDLLGVYECSLAKAASAGRHEGKLTADNDKQTIIVSVEETSEYAAYKHEYILGFAAQIYSRTGFRSKSLHFTIAQDQDGVKAETYQSAKKRSKVRYMRKRFCHSAEWDVWDTSLPRVCGHDGNKQRNLWFTVYANGRPHSELVTTLNDLGQDVSTDNPKILPLQKPGSTGGIVQINSEVGKLWVTKFDHQYVPSFLNFIQTGTRLEFAIAIDFSETNGPVSSPSSLHHISPGKPNDYMLAIEGVGQLIEDYSTNIPLWGFGATLPRGGISHDFFFNLNQTNPYCDGVSGVLEAYIKCAETVEPAGPTNFAPVINHVARTASVNAGTAEKYHILLILTDGVITDMKQTKKALIDASTFPLSVIIVGIGFHGFHAMHILDEKPLSHKGQTAKRNIVTFWRLHDIVECDMKRPIPIASPLFREISEQFAAYMKMHRLQPLEDPLEARRGFKQA